MIRLGPVPWPPLLAAGAGAAGICVLAALRPSEELGWHAVRVAAAALAGGAAYLLDDPAAPLTAAVPERLGRRRQAVVIPGLAILSVVWAMAALLVAWRLPVLPVLGLTVEVAAMACVALGAAAVLASRGEQAPGVVVGPVLLLVVVGTIIFDPAPVVPIWALPGEHWVTGRLWWGAFAVLGMVALVLASHDPSRRPAAGASAGGEPAERHDRTGSLDLGQRLRLVHRLAAALVTSHEVLRLVGGGLDLAATRLGLLGDLLLDPADRGAAVASPLDLVALGELLAHVRLPVIVRAHHPLRARSTASPMRWSRNSAGRA